MRLLFRFIDKEGHTVRYHVIFFIKKGMSGYVMSFIDKEGLLINLFMSDFDAESLLFRWFFHRNLYC